MEDPAVIRPVFEQYTDIPEQFEYEEFIPSVRDYNKVLYQIADTICCDLSEFDYNLLFICYFYFIFRKNPLFFIVFVL